MPKLTAATPQAASQENITPFGAYPIPCNTSRSATCTPVSQPVKSVARGWPCASKVSKTIILVTLQAPGNGDKATSAAKLILLM